MSDKLKEAKKLLVGAFTFGDEDFYSYKGNEQVEKAIDLIVEATEEKVFARLEKETEEVCGRFVKKMDEAKKEAEEKARKYSPLGLWDRALENLKEHQIKKGLSDKSTKPRDGFDHALQVTKARMPDLDAATKKVAVNRMNRFLQEIKDEAKAEGPEAVQELTDLESHYREVRKSLVRPRIVLNGKVLTDEEYNHLNMLADYTINKFAPFSFSEGIQSLEARFIPQEILTAVGITEPSSCGGDDDLREDYAFWLWDNLPEFIRKRWAYKH